MRTRRVASEKIPRDRYATPTILKWPSPYEESTQPSPMTKTHTDARRVGTSTPKRYSSTSVTVGVNAASICVNVIVRYM